MIKIYRKINLLVEVHLKKLSVFIDFHILIKIYKKINLLVEVNFKKLSVFIDFQRHIDELESCPGQVMWHKIFVCGARLKEWSPHPFHKDNVFSPCLWSPLNNRRNHQLEVEKFSFIVKSSNSLLKTFEFD